MMTTPTAMNCQNGLMAMITRPLASTAMISAPISVPDHRAGAAKERCAADDDGGNRIEQHGLPGVGRAVGKAQVVQEAGEGRKEGRDKIDRGERAHYRNAGTQRCLLVAANRIGVQSELGAREREMGDERAAQA